MIVRCGAFVLHYIARGIDLKLIALCGLVFIAGNSVADRIFSRIRRAVLLAENAHRYFGLSRLGQIFGLYGHENAVCPDLLPRALGKAAVDVSGKGFILPAGMFVCSARAKRNDKKHKADNK